MSFERVLSRSLDGRALSAEQGVASRDIEFGKNCHPGWYTLEYGNYGNDLT